ncbi:hypothetical protein D3C85_14920 [compost metagenome]
MSEQDLPTSVGDISEGFYDVLETQRVIVDGQIELESLLNATDALESLSTHLETHGVVSTEHRQALVISFENLISTSGLSVRDFVPELDGHEMGTVSTESLKDKLYALWKRIVAATLSVLTAIKSYWVKVVSFRGRLMMNAEHMAKLGAVRKMATVKNQEVALGIEIKSLILGDRPITDGDSLIRALSFGIDQYKAFTDIYSKEMISIGSKFESVLTGTTSGQEALHDTCHVFETMPIMKMATKLRAMVYRDPRFGNRMTLAAPPTIGGWTVYFLTLEREQEALKETSLPAYAMALRTTGIKFTYSNPNGYNVTSGKVKTAHGLQVQSIALKVIDLLETIDAQEKAVAISRVEAQVKAVLRAGERYQSRVISSNGYDQNVLRFVRSYANWAVGPVNQMTTNLLSVSRSALLYCRKSIENH